MIAGRWRVSVAACVLVVVGNPAGWVGGRGLLVRWSVIAGAGVYLRAGVCLSGLAVRCGGWVAGWLVGVSLCWVAGMRVGGSGRGGLGVSLWVGM